ncbi:MAG: hypothetical protein ACYT04_69755, partial [Nostoc sp.]
LLVNEDASVQLSPYLEVLHWADHTLSAGLGSWVRVDLFDTWLRFSAKLAKVIPVSADASRRAAYYLYFIRAIAPFQALRWLVSFDSCDRSSIQNYNQNICLSIKSEYVAP